MPDPYIIGAKEGQPCSNCDEPIVAGHSCSRLVEKTDENSKTRIMCQMVMVPEHFEPRPHFVLRSDE
jgi:hypothetical protein